MAWVLGVTAGLLALAALATAFGGGDTGSALIVALVNALLAVCAWRWGTHPLIGASDAGVTVRNPLRSLVVPWDDVVGCRATARGVTLLRRSGPPVVAWAVQKPSVSAWTGRHTVADDVVAYLVDRALGGDGEGALASGPTASGGLPGSAGPRGHLDADAPGETRRPGDASAPDDPGGLGHEPGAAGSNGADA